MSDEANLVAAIMEGDLEGAKAILDEIRWTSDRWAEAYQTGRIIAFPPAPLLPLAEPETFPIPGHLHGSFLGGPHITKA